MVIESKLADDGCDTTFFRVPASLVLLWGDAGKRALEMVGAERFPSSFGCCVDGMGDVTKGRGPWRWIECVCWGGFLVVCGPTAAWATGFAGDGAFRSAWR